MTMIEDARCIREYPDEEQQLAEGAKMLREAMVLTSLGRITNPERQQVFALLAFAVPVLDSPFSAPPQLNAFPREPLD